MKKLALTTVVTSLALAGCATKDYVHEYVDGQIRPINARLDGNEAADAAREAALGTRLEGVSANIAQLDTRVGQNETAIGELRRTTQDALERATAAGKLAEGKLVHEVVLTDDQLRFGSDRVALSDEAKAVLDDFAARLKAENQNVYLEIQGHTDSRGEELANLRVGELRALAVRNYLNVSGGIPLHRMAVISYGESQPIADNRFRAGREQNRRVVLVVLK